MDKHSVKNVSAKLIAIVVISQKEISKDSLTHVDSFPLDRLSSMASFEARKASSP